MVLNGDKGLIEVYEKLNKGKYGNGRIKMKDERNMKEKEWQFGDEKKYKIKEKRFVSEERGENVKILQMEN